MDSLTFGHYKPLFAHQSIVDATVGDRRGERCRENAFLYAFNDQSCFGKILIKLTEITKITDAKSNSSNTNNRNNINNRNSSLSSNTRMNGKNKTTGIKETELLETIKLTVITEIAEAAGIIEIATETTTKNAREIMKRQNNKK